MYLLLCCYYYYVGYNWFKLAFVLSSDFHKQYMVLQALYGEKSSVPKGGVKPQTEEPPGSEEDGELCNDATVDTLFNSAEGVTYAFKGTIMAFWYHSIL